jgi:hypothetical protein
VLNLTKELRPAIRGATGVLTVPTVYRRGFPKVTNKWVPGNVT